MVTRIRKDDSGVVLAFERKQRERQAGEAADAVMQLRAAVEANAVAPLSTAMQASIDLAAACRAAGVTTKQGETMLAAVLSLDLPRMTAVLMTIEARRKR